MIQSAFVIVNDVLLRCCSDQTCVELPEGITQIGECAFSGCENLQSVTLPQSLTVIDSFAFLYCEQLQSISLPPALKRIGKAAFKGCRGLADENGLVVINRMVHDYCGGEKNVVIPEGVTTIGYEAFFRNKNIQSVTIPRSVENISSCAFDGCDNLVLRVFPGSPGETFAREKGIPFASNQ